MQRKAQIFSPKQNGNGSLIKKTAVLNPYFGYVLALLGCANGASICTSATLEASFRIDDVLAVTLGNCANRASFCASAALDALIRNHVCHCRCTSVIDSALQRMQLGILIVTHILKNARVFAKSFFTNSGGRQKRFLSKMQFSYNSSQNKNKCRETLVNRDSFTCKGGNHFL